MRLPCLLKLSLSSGKRNRRLACGPMHGLVNRARSTVTAISCRGNRSCWFRCRHEMHGLHGIVGPRLFHDGCDFAEPAVRRGTDGVEHRFVDGLEDKPLVFEFHLALLRMNVDINRALWHLNLEHSQRKPTLGNQRLIGVVDGLGNGAVLDDAAVDDIGLPAAAALEQRRFRDIAADFNFFAVKAQCQQRIRDICTIDGLYRVKQIIIARRHNRHLVVVDEMELDIGPRQSEFYNKVVDFRTLGVVRLEEFLARRRVEK